jgi:hypothetical protein
MYSIMVQFIIFIWIKITIYMAQLDLELEAELRAKNIGYLLDEPEE